MDYFGYSHINPKDVATSIMNEQKKDKDAKVEMKEITVDKMLMYKVEVNYSHDSSVLAMWFFADKDKGMHYLEAEGPTGIVQTGIDIIEKLFL